MATRKNAKGKKNTKKAVNKFYNSQIAAVITFFLSILFLLFSIIEGENVWNNIHNFFLGTFGFLSFPIFILSAYISVRISFGKFDGEVLLRVIGESAFIVFLASVVNIFAYEDGIGYGTYLLIEYKNGISGGGILGGLLGYPFAKFFGITGAAIILILIMVLLVFLTTGMTLMQFFTAMSKPAKKIKDDTQNIIEMGKVALSQRKNNYDISLDGMPEQPQKSKEKTNLSTKQKRVIDLYNDEPEEQPVIEQEDEEVNEYSQYDDIQETNPDIDDIINGINERSLINTEEPEVKNTPKPNVNTNPGIIVTSDEPEEYRYPPLSLLEESSSGEDSNIGEELKKNAERLVDTLRSFGVETRIINISRGPTVTRYELQPAAGVKISKITNLADDIALNLATSGVRIEAPIPNKAAVGIEVPNKSVASVSLREIIGSKKFEEAKSKLTVAVGKDIAGNVVTADLAKMPHLLIAGTTGSGKSVCINSFILSTLYKASPEEVKLIMIDPKVVELEVYNGLPNLMIPVVTDPKKASGTLGWAVTEMEERYKLFGECKVRDLKSYNEFAKKTEGYKTKPQILIVVDELNDLMMAAPKEVEDSICRLAQKARAAGMHLVVATQRPSVDVITGLIKANIPSRIALKVSNRADSGTIIDTVGAEKLLGKGDMLFYPVGSSKPIRVQGCWVSDNEIKDVVNYIIGESENEAKYDETVTETIDKLAAEVGKNKKAVVVDGSGGDAEEDEMLSSAIEVVIDAGSASTSLLQRKLKLGYGRAARIIDSMESKGIVGPYEGSKPRKVLISRQQWLEMKMNGTDDSDE